MISFSTKHLDYLECNYLDELDGKVEDAAQDFVIPEPEWIGLLRILGISRFWERYKEKIASMRYLMEDVLAGLHGEKIPLLYLIAGGSSRINLFIGSYHLKAVGENLTTIRAALESAYPGIEFREQGGQDLSPVHDIMNSFNFAGLMTGTPTVKVGTQEIGVEQIERLIRGLYGMEWSYIVIATPVAEPQIVNFCNSALNELRLITDAETSARIKSPIAERYKELLQGYLKRLELGKRGGIWDTAVYFLTQDMAAFNYAKAIVKSVFAGEESRPSPIRIMECHGLKEEIKRFAQILTPSPSPPGQIRYPYKYLNTITSRELACLTHLPMEEMPGYFVKDYARFDVASHYSGKGDAVEIGEVIDRGRAMGYEYQFGLKDLDRHGLIVGTTGSGKTNTIFHMLKQIWQKGVPFMVIEPAKTEYRKLLQSTEFGDDLQVFTLGDNSVSPFRLNLFEIMPGISVQSHIDRLKSVFNASFIMYAPMPYVLERCIHELYEDKGWDLATNENRRGESRNAYPTLTDLFGKVDDVVSRLGYEEKITMDVRAALRTRINSLRIGGKGLMLDTKQSIPIEKLIQRPTILELEQIGDDDEKCFVIGLLLMFLYEHYVSHGLEELGEEGGLRHVTVIEEAHRLLRNVPLVQDTEVANMKGKALETFCNILSEVRAYGEGFLIAEQIPSKLAPDVVKNSNLKVMHRTVSEEDRQIMGGAMNLDGWQEKRITSLGVGEAAVYSEGDDIPLHIKVPYSKITSRGLSRGDENHRIREVMGGFAQGLTKVFTPFDNCWDYCGLVREDIAKCQYRKEAERIVETSGFDEVFSFYVLSAVESPSALVEEYPTIIQAIEERIEGLELIPDLILCIIIQAVERYFEKRGQQYAWNYREDEVLKTSFMGLLSKVIKYYGEIPGEDKLTKLFEEMMAFQAGYKQLCTRQYDPFMGCKDTCGDGLCPYRYNVQALLGDGYLNRSFNEAMRADEVWEELAHACDIARRRIISDAVDEEAKRRVSLCFAIQKAYSQSYFDASLREMTITSLLRTLQAES